MATAAQQRDRVYTFKKETLLNVGLLSKVHPMPVDLFRQIFNENALEKLTQSVFNHLTYYLVVLVDKAASPRLPWPLYDSETMKAYRNELSNILADYSSTGLLSPVMSSYLVNPGCYKVTKLMLELTQLAVQRMLLSKMKNNSQKALFNEVTEKFKSCEGDSFTEDKTRIMLSKFANHLHKKEMLEKKAELLRNTITDMEYYYVWLKSEVFDYYIFKDNYGPEMREEYLRLVKIKNKHNFFNLWLEYFDGEIEKLESSFDCKMTPLLEACKKCQDNTEKLIARQTGKVDRKTFTVEYNPKTDEICTRTLEEQVNSQQKYVLKNIVKDNKLNFPNLIRGCLISMCYVYQNIEFGDEIFRFNKYLESGRQNYSEIISTMKILLERVSNAENRLETRPSISSQSISIRDSELPPLPDLSDLKMNREYHNQVLFDTFTPWNPNKHQFNLRRKHTVNNSFIKPAPKTNSKVTGKTSSLEKIINRFKKVRTSYFQSDSKEDYTSDIRPVLEEKENFNTVNVDVFTENRILLPHLVSPSCSIISTSNDYMEQLCFDDDEKPREARESLGTALGVDNTFLDQFDLID